MSFFPINIVITENLQALWVTDANLDLLSPHSEEQFLQALSEFLNNIKKAAWRHLGVISYSTQVASFSHTLSPNQNIPSGLQSLQWMRHLVHYIQHWSAYTYPSLFASADSLGLQMCIQTIETLQEFITSQLRLGVPFMEEASTSSAIASALSFSLFPKAPLAIESPTIRSESQQRSLENDDGSSEEIDVTSLSPLELTKSPEQKPSLAIGPPPIRSESQKRSLENDNDSSEEIDVTSLSPLELTKSTEQEPPSKKTKISSVESAQDLLEPLAANLSTVGTLLSTAIIEESDEEEDIVDTPFPAPSAFVLPIAPKTTVQSEITRIDDDRVAATSLVKKDSPNLREYISIKMLPHTDYFTITGFKNFLTVEALKLFLKNILEATNRSSYFCSAPIPEIFPVTSSNKKDLLRILYASALRNTYFFTQNKPMLSSSVQPLVQHTLSSLNRSYCAFLKTPSNDLTHHQDLLSFAISPPKRFYMPEHLSWITIFTRPETPRDLTIQEHHYTEIETSQNLRRIKKNLQLSLDYFNMIKTKSHFRIKCYDNSVQLSHYQQKLLTQSEVIKILEEVVKNNKEKYANYYANVSEIEGAEFMTKNDQQVQKLFDQVDSLLQEWRTHDFVEEDEKENQTLIDALQEQFDNENDKTLTRIYYLIPHPHFDIFTIRVNSSGRMSSLQQFRQFIIQVTNNLSRSGYLSYHYVPVISEAHSQDPKNILKTLFTLTCANALLYQNIVPDDETSHSLDPETVSSLFTLLKTIDRKYCENTNTPFDSSNKVFHPDLNQIILQNNTFNFLNRPNAIFSFPYCHIEITFTGSKRNVKFVNKTNSNASLRFLLRHLHLNFSHICSNLLRLVQTPQQYYFYVHNTNTSYTHPIHTGSQINRDLVLHDCLKILKHNHDLFKQLPYLDVATSLTHYNRIFENLSFTIQYLTNFLETGILPTPPIPLSLQEDLHIFLCTLSTKKSMFIVKQQDIHAHRQDKTKTICNAISTTQKIIRNKFLTPSPVTTIKGNYENTLTGEIIPVETHTHLIPFIYRGLQQNLLQLQQILKKKLLNQHLQVNIENVTKAITSTRETLALLSNAWEQYFPGEALPSLSSLASEFRQELHLSAGQLKILREELKTFVNNLQDNHTRYSQFLFSTNDFDEVDIEDLESHTS